MLHKLHIYNRPIAPHLLIYSPQVSSLFSIWHRITGVILTSIITTFLINLKIFILSNFYGIWFFQNMVLIFKFTEWNLKYIYLIILVLVLYHILNGIRHIFWDFKLFLNNKALIISSIIFLLIISLILFTNII